MNRMKVEGGYVKAEIRASMVIWELNAVRLKHMLCV